MRLMSNSIDLLGKAGHAGRRSGDNAALAAWFRGELKPLAHDVLLDERARSRGWLQRGAVERLLGEHEAGDADNGHRIWTLVMLELWQRTHVDLPVTAGAA